VTYRHIHERNTTPEIRVRLQLIHQRVLAPITYHKPDPHLHEGDQEGERCGARVQRGHVVQEGVARELGDQSTEGEVRFAFAIKVEGQFGPDEEEEAADVVEEVE